MFYKISKFMLSDLGKKVSYFAAGTLSVGTLFVGFLPHTLLLNEYKKFLQLYKNGFAVPVSQILNNRFQKALELLETNSLDVHLYKPFYVSGFDVMSAGSSSSKYGVIIGLPNNFSFDKIDTVDTSKILLGGESIIWDSEPAQNLLKSLILSENAQLYAMAKEILYRQTPKPIMDIILGVNLVVCTYALSNHLNRKFNFYSKPVSVRVFMYSLVGLLNLGFYLMSKDTSQVYYEGKIDKELLQKSKVFQEGGKEYYLKQLERNKALRQLLGKEGENRYSVLGNENHFLRIKHTPLVQRLSNFECEG